MTPGRFAALALGGTVALAGAAALGIFNPRHIENTAASIAERRPLPPEPAVVAAPMPVREAAAGDSQPPKSVLLNPVLPKPVLPKSVLQKPVLSAARSSAAEVTTVELALTDSGPKPPPETGMHLATAPASAPADDGAKPPVRSIEPFDRCVTDICIDEYLWSLYERTPKIDTVKVPEQVKVTVKKKGKTRVVTQTVMTPVVDDFTWKDPAAAQRRGISVMEYVIGGMDHDFKLKLYRALRAMDDAGLMPGITSGFRDDYRQSIASGKRAASDSSYHGGSRRGGYRHGLAADLVSVKGDTRMGRYAASEELWKWIDAHEKEFGIGRPYLDRDPPHVGPIDGTEYIVKRALANAQKRSLQAKTAEKPHSETTRRLSARIDAGATKHANPAKASKLSSLQKRLTLPR